MLGITPIRESKLVREQRAITDVTVHHLLRPRGLSGNSAYLRLHKVFPPDDLSSSKVAMLLFAPLFSQD